MRIAMSHIRSAGVAKRTIAALFVVLSSSEAFALKYVIPYPNDKRDAMTFAVHEKKNGSFHFRVILDEKKLGSRVAGFQVMAYPKPREGHAARGVEFSAALLRDRDGRLHVTFVLDKELAYVGYIELAVAPLPPETRELPGGTFYAFRISDFVEFGPEAISAAEMQRRIEELSRTGRFQNEKDPARSVNEVLPHKVRPMPEKVD